MATTPSNFMLIFRNGGPDVHAHLNSEQRAQLAQRWNDWVERLAREKALLHGQPLGPTGRVVSGSSGAVTDGPYAEATEVIAGYIAVRAAGIDAAAEIAKQCPGLPLGLTVEVRPLTDVSPVLTEVRARPAPAAHSS